MIIPPYLKKGSTISFAAPARKISKSEIENVENWLKNYGFNIFYDDDLFLEDHQFAGSDLLRAQYFQKLLDNPNIDAIWCVRGGYGSARIIDLLDFSNFVNKPKWICGYSDITVFHNHILQNCGVATLHSTMPINIKDCSKENAAMDSFLSALKGEILEYQVFAHDLSRLGDFTGEIVGGNLSVIYSLLGSPSDIDTDGKILLIEDLEEYLYHIDRMMLNLKRNGKLKNLKALFVGHLNDMLDNTIPFGKTAEEIVYDYCKEYDYPIIFNVPAGHLVGNYAFRLGCRTEATVHNNVLTIKNLPDV